MSQKNLQTLKGFRDFLPKEALKRKWLRQKLEQIFELWGYDPMETPVLEPLEIFQGQIGEDEKLFYKFKDLGGRDVALRYDQTVPTCRVVGQYGQEIALPFKRYQIQMAFRAEKPQKGRYREFLQADADIFGVTQETADAETIALSLDIYKRLGFKKAKVLINDRSLLKGIPYQALSSIDKLKKIGEGGVIADMVKKGIGKAKAVKYLKEVSEAKPGKGIQIILGYLASVGFDKDWYAFDPTIIRSFSYSTGPIWEVEIPDFEVGSVLGGERYDSLVANISGKNIAGTGFGLGFDRTLEAAEQFNLIPQIETSTKVLVTIFSEKLLGSSLKVAEGLRKALINTEVYPDKTAKLDKQLKYAVRKGVPWVVIIGPDEVVKGTVKLKNMQDKKQEDIQLSVLATRIK